MKLFVLIHLTSLFCLFLSYQTVYAQVSPVVDTLAVYSLPTVQIQGKITPSALQTTAPVQVMDAKQIQALQAVQVSDALKYFSGVQVKDYGGVGGLKTVSVRNLGASHTGVFYDGVPVSNYQSGQTDLGKFSLQNIEQLVLYIGEGDDIFLPASRQIGASVLHIQRKTTLSGSSKKRQIGTFFNTASWGYYNPGFLYEQSAGSNTLWDISAEYTGSEGDYPYQSGSGESKRRSFSDLSTAQLEANVSSILPNGGRLQVKTYGYYSDRRLPGPDIFYVDAKGEKALEKQSSTQALYQQQWNKQWKFKALAKWDLSSTRYQHFSTIYPSGERRSNYRQNEYFVSAVVQYSPHSPWSISWANDGASGIFRNDFSGLKPSRLTWLSNLSVHYRASWISLTSSLLSSCYADTKQKTAGSEHETVHQFSPYLGVSVKPFSSTPWRLRAFYKHSFRQFALGDMYFSPIPPSSLLPEKAKQFNLGSSYTSYISETLPYLSFSVDAYHNTIDNKLWAIPRSSLFIWSVQNIDISMKGIEGQVNATLQPAKNWQVQLGGNYSYQEVVDCTQPGTDTYKKQMVYTPKHTASGLLSVETPWIGLHYHVLYTGSRYFERIPRPQYLLPSFAEHGIGLSSSFTTAGIQWKCTASCQNFTNKRYEVVRSYPMPGRLFRLGVQMNY